MTLGCSRILDFYRTSKTLPISPDGRPVCIFGDPAYPLRLHLQAPFRNAVMTPQMEAFNVSMSTVRTSFEWLFGDITNYFKFV